MNAYRCCQWMAIPPWGFIAPRIGLGDYFGSIGTLVQFIGLCGMLYTVYVIVKRRRNVRP